ncbi:MAG: P-loop NTPase fold protein, partial [Pseudomonadota bacterium]
MADDNKLSHNDAPLIVEQGDDMGDLLGRSKFIKHVCAVISDCQPPKGIAINGYWGSGKTSALMQVYYQLSGKHPYGETVKTPDTRDMNIVPVWFEAWRYQHEGQPIIALLHEIREQMGVWQKFLKQSEKVASVALLGAVNAFDEAIKSASGG